MRNLAHYHGGRGAEGGIISYYVNRARIRNVAAVSLLTVLCPSAFALDPSLDLSQYAHTSWTIREGFFKGIVLSMAQTADGYLWLGTEFGLLRFDGVRPVEWTPPGGEHLPSQTIMKLLAGRDGTLWIGTRAGLASWNGSKLTRHPELDTLVVNPILEDREGTVWAGGMTSGAGRLCAIRGGKAQCWGQDGSLGAGVLSLYEDSRGAIWAGADSALWRWKPGPPKRYAMPEREIRELIQNDDGQLLIAMPNGVRRLEKGKTLPYPMGGKVNVSRVIRDRHGALWIGTAGQGLIHVHRRRTDSFSRLDGLSADNVLSIFEDREGDIWVSTYQGLDRFREFSVVTLSPKQGLSGDSVFSVLAARDGSVWLSGRNGLDRWKDGQATTLKKANGLPDDGPHSLFQDEAGRIWAFSLHGCAYFEDARFVACRDVPGGHVASIAGHADHLWVSQDRGLLHLLDGRVVDQSPWSDPERRQGASVIVADRDEGGIWLGFWGGGLDYLKNGQTRRSYSSKEGLGGGRISDLRVAADNTLLAATESGLSLIKHGHIATLTSKDGLPCDEVYWSMEAADGSTWLYMPCGLARITRTDLDAWIGDSTRKIPMTVLDGSDGVTAHVAAGSSWPRVAKSNDGRIWFVSFDGVISVLDPAHLPFNKIPPPVHIERIIADDKPYDFRPGLRLPANVRNLRIEYTALSLVAPEKIHFKYKLEGQNRNWHEVINERQATYTNLPPRNYRFRVIASNNSGVWNETGDTLEFSIAPAYYQTNWFRALLAATVLALMGAVYQFRMRQVQRESRRLRDVIETIPAYVWSALPDGFVDFVNRRWLAFTGFSLDQSLGSGWADALHPEDRAGLLDTWRTAIASGEAMEAEARMQSADGQYRWLLFRCVPQRDAAGKIVKWYGKSTDIEDRKRAEQEREKLRQLEADLAHLNRVSIMGELAASVAHEVNQPLTGIVSNGSACLRWLAGDAPNLEEARDAVRDIVRDGKRAGEVIARIRALTKRAAPPKEKLDLNEVVREVLALVGDQAKKNSVIIRTQFADNIWPVLGDRVQLQQVLLNLVMNGMEAMSSVGERERQLSITTRNIDPDQVQVTVEDSGVGLDPNTKSRLFEAFYTTKSGGMGMGLSICRSILQNHGGRLWATPNAGPGTSFHFSLPKYHEQDASVAAV